MVTIAGSVGELNDFDLYNLVGNNSAKATEFEQYKKEALLEGPVNIVHWWRDNRHRYPILTRIALDLLAAPVTTAADERKRQISSR